MNDSHYALTDDSNTSKFDDLGTFVFDAILLALFIPLYSGVLFYLFIRRHYQPLKNRGSTLIIVSCAGNFLFGITLIINKMIANAFKVGSFYESPDKDHLAPPNQAVVEFSCAISHIQYGVFMPLFFFPYFLRAYRLYLVYTEHVRHFQLKKKRGVLAFKRVRSLHCAREKNQLKWLAVILAPLIVLTFVAVLVPGFRQYFPSFEVKSCFLGNDRWRSGSDIDLKFHLHLLLTVQVYLVFNFVLDALLMTFIYMLRKVQPEFSMNSELLVVTGTQLILGFFIYFLLVIAPDSQMTKSNNMQYIMAFRGLLFLYVTAIMPLRASYNPNSIIPFPINEECIKTLEMALLMPTSANYFYEYLETLCGSEKSRDALVYFGLYADIRAYLRLIEDGEGQDALREHAQQVLRDYIYEDTRQWEVNIPDDVLAELRASVDPDSPSQIDQAMVLDENFFSSLYFFVLDVLEGYYQDFKRSRKYDQLKDEVSKQEILYEYLRRYSMISN